MNMKWNSQQILTSSGYFEKRTSSATPTKRKERGLFCCLASDLELIATLQGNMTVHYNFGGLREPYEKLHFCILE